LEILSKYFLAMAFMLFFLFAWFMVQKLSRKVAMDLPEFGKAREEGGGCGGSGKCNCNSVKDCSNFKVKT
jgi:hypothetical protein